MRWMIMIIMCFRITRRANERNPPPSLGVQITRTPIIIEKTSTNLLHLAASRSTTSSLPSTRIGDETYTVNDDAPLVEAACSILAKVGPECLLVCGRAKRRWW